MVGGKLRWTLLVDLAKFFFQVSDQLLDPLRGVRVRRHLPGELAVSQNLHFQFDAFVFDRTADIPALFYKDAEMANLFNEPSLSG